LSAWAQKDTVPPPPTDIQTLPGNDGTLTRVERQPQFPGGDQALVAYMNANLHYPDGMRQARKEGVVHVAFTISAEGDVQNVHVQRGIAGGEALNEEAVRVVSAMPRWQPALVNGVPVPMAYVLPVTFAVSDKP
ncbi:MAG TPA: energy transducer TonB, partial [Flavobacteriales bacterium]|nr:energy transducer TonB [Flavobacteriales bacterium]